MKQKIDDLVRNLLTDLDRPSPANPQLAGVVASLGLDGPSMAAAQRAILASWAKDVMLLAEHRVYAGQQLDALPSF